MSNTQEGHKSESEEAPQARTLEEGVAAAGKYEGDPLDCPCLKDMKEGLQHSSLVLYVHEFELHAGLR